MNRNEKTKELVKQQFSSHAEAYVKSESHAKGDDLSLLIEWLQPKTDWKALDIATGGGHVAKALSKKIELVVAVDLTPEMLSSARRHLEESGCRNVLYVVADAEALPFLDETFDAVTCRIAPHHFPDPEQFIRETSRVLRRGGSFLMIDNVAPEDDRLAGFMNTVEKKRDRSHVRCLSVEEWTRAMMTSKLEIVQSRTRKKKFTFPSWVRRTAESEAQVQEVEEELLSAPRSIQEYFCVKIDEGKIESFQIDEWMVLCRKQ